MESTAIAFFIAPDMHACMHANNQTKKPFKKGSTAHNRGISTSGHKQRLPQHGVRNRNLNAEKGKGKSAA